VTQSQLNRAVARATGESIATIRSLGFGIVDPATDCHEPEPLPWRPQVVDWDERDANRYRVLPR